MRPVTVCAFVSLVSLGACRSIVGIEALSVGDEGGAQDGAPGPGPLDATSGAQPDSTPIADGRGDATADAPVHVVDSGPTTASDASRDAGDAAPEPTDGPPAEPPEGGCQTGTREMCLSCCFGSNGSSLMSLLSMQNGGGMCLCGPPTEACSTECSSSFCNQQSGGQMPTSQCVDCTASAFFAEAGACRQVLGACGSSCKPLSDCFAACPP